MAVIKIKPENKGKFTATKKATGKNTEELTHSKNPVTKKRAIFAQNAKKWNKKQDGGNLVPEKVLKYMLGGTLQFSCGGIMKKQSGGTMKPKATTATADSTKHFSKKLGDNINEFMGSKNASDKDLAARKVTQTKGNLSRQSNKGKPGYDKNGFPLK